jgi:hypothetical protein
MGRTEWYVRVNTINSIMRLLLLKSFQDSGESANEENCFVKEARLMFSLNHEKILTFKAFSSFPCAIMMEYLCFNFSIFEIQKELKNLTDFLNFIDKVDALSYFPNNLMPKIAFEISKGLTLVRDRASRSKS